MSNSIIKRSIALLTAVLVMTAFTFIITENASAASKKSYYLATKEVVKDKSGKIISEENFVYDKNGLMKESKNSVGVMKYNRNSKGYLTDVKRTDSDGKKWTIQVTKRNKYGLPLEFVMPGNGSESYVYKGNLVRSLTEVMETGASAVTKVNDRWFPTSYVEKDKDGKVVSKMSVDLTKYKSGARKGYAKVAKFTIESYNDGKKTTEQYTSKYKYEINKHGKITKFTETTTGDMTAKTVTTIKYKKFKVPKKYRDLLKEWINPSWNL